MSLNTIPVGETHSFNVRLAAEYGIYEAIVIKSIYMWVTHNAMQNINYRNGRYWTYNSKKAMTEYFPYFTKRQLEHTLDKLRQDGLILVDNFNKTQYDRTLWYTLSDKAYELLGCEPAVREKEPAEGVEENFISEPKCANSKNKNEVIHYTNLCNPNTTDGQPIPSTYTNTYNKSSSSSVSSPFPEELFDEDEDGELRSALKGVKDLNSEEMRELVRLKKDHGTKALCETLKTALLHKAKFVIPYMKKLLTLIQKPVAPKKEKRKPKKVGIVNAELLTTEEYDNYLHNNILPDREGIVTYEYV